MLIEFNSGYDREAKSLDKLIKVPVRRPLRIPESGEIRLLFSFRKAGFPPFTVVRNGLATTVATQKWQLGTVSAIPAICCCFSITISVVIAIATNVVVFFFRFSAKMAVSDVSQKYDVILRIFKISKYQNILTFTV